MELQDTDDERHYVGMCQISVAHTGQGHVDLYSTDEHTIMSAGVRLQGTHMSPTRVVTWH